MTWLLELVEKGDIWESFSWEGFPAAISPLYFIAHQMAFDFLGEKGDI